MKKEDFSKWMNARIKENSARDCISRCKRVEKHLEIDLDKEYKRDKGESLLQILLTRNATEKEIELLAKKLGLDQGTNYRSGIADMKSAVNRYFKYLSEKHK